MKVRRIAPKQQFRQKRVAAYARVSTLKEEQEESFETQVAYYTNLIENNDDWEFAGIFSDQGFSGVSAEKRPGFQKMIKSADNGNIDLILVKSISRFARNAIEAQEYLRMLKNLNVEVRFEREHISSFDQTAEMTFNMLAAMAQEESHAISRRMRWSLDKRAEKGERKIVRVFGYDVKNGELMPNRDAKVVKEIFKLYSEGYSSTEISEILAKKHGTEISYSTVTKMLKNEIYVGDRHIQKSAPQNYLTKKPDDTVSYDSYYVQDNHEGIVSRELWKKVQERINGPRRHRNSHFMYGTIYCEKCGFPMSRITVTLKGKKVPVWKCSQHIKSKELCPQGYIKEEELMENIRRQMRWNLFFPKAYAEKIRRVEVGEEVEIIIK